MIKVDSDAKYPFHVSEKVSVKRKVIESTRGEDPADNNWYVGSALRGQDSLRGLNFDEEKKYLHDIIGVSPTSERWTPATKEYWANVRVLIPSGAGKELEIGFKYPTAEIAEEAEATGNYAIKQEKGEPINVSDYIFWRYCKLYRRVAATIGDINKSPNIAFYLYSKNQETQDKKKEMKQRDAAFQQRMRIMGDRQLVDDVLVLFNEPVDSLNDDEKDIALEKYATADHLKFLQVVGNTNLKMEAFIERCIAKRMLRRLDNTDTIVYGDNTVLGSNIKDAAINLTTVPRSSILNALKAKMQEAKSLAPVVEKLPELDALIPDAGTGTNPPAAVNNQASANATPTANGNAPVITEGQTKDSGFKFQ